jgi:hypothetical protein
MPTSNHANEVFATFTVLCAAVSVMLITNDAGLVLPAITAALTGFCCFATLAS